MKYSSLISATLISGILSIGLVTQASAMPHGDAFSLQQGNTPTRIASGMDHYRFQVEDPSQIRISSQVWHEVAGGKVTAALRDGNGNLVARSRGNGRNFILEQRLQPGSYTLEVNASRNGGGRESMQRYSLTTDLR
jgi:hypothetical protein